MDILRRPLPIPSRITASRLLSSILLQSSPYMHLQLTIQFLLLSVLVSWSSLINAAPLPQSGLSDRSKDATYLDVKAARSPKPPARDPQPNLSGDVDSGGAGRRGFESQDQEQPGNEMPARKLVKRPFGSPTLDPKPARRYGTKTKAWRSSNSESSSDADTPSTNGSLDTEQEDNQGGSYGIPQMRGLTLVKKPGGSISYSEFYAQTNKQELDSYRERVDNTAKRADRNKVLPHSVPYDMYEHPRDYGVLDFKVKVR
ncbi:hypothetical protein C8J57DRAFT_1518547 [Mycena rebaudengoi]|nr:hypothetical protein C8J57DRAFT_1518547 [Mycena rebaudengoi]